MKRDARNYTEVELEAMPIGTMMIQWEPEYDELSAGWVRREAGWHDPDVPDVVFSSHMIWGPDSTYEIIYDPRVD